MTVEGLGSGLRPQAGPAQVTEVQEKIIAQMPTSPEATRLSIPEGIPALDVVRTYHTAEGALDVARFVMRAGMAACDYRLPVPD